MKSVSEVSRLVGAKVVAFLGNIRQAKRWRRRRLPRATFASVNSGMIMTDEQLIFKALAALDAPNNEPVRWLMGESLRSQSAWPTYPHFLLTALTRPRTGSLVSWNAWIDEFRKLLVSPDQAPPKVTADLRSKGTEVEDKLRGVGAEIQAVIELKNRGFSDFAVVPRSDVATPDFEAKFQDKSARIEVKNLGEPSDHIRMIVTDEWEKQTKLAPPRYNFNATLRHDHRGTISRKAESRLRNILAQFPDMNRAAVETLDGGVDIRLERIGNLGNSPEAVMQKQLLREGELGRIVIVNPIRLGDFEFDVSGMQALFLKALRTIVLAQAKFFGKETIDREALNVIVLRWEHPEPFYDPQMVEWTEKRIEQLYDDFGLQLRVVIFSGNGPEMSWETLNQFK
jgi:hypothetical protein